MLVGTVKEIWRHPVKSMTGERLDGCTVSALGIPGDRGWALRDEQTREITNGKRIPLLMQCVARYVAEPTKETIPNVEMHLTDGSMLLSSDPNVNARLSALVGRKVTLWPRRPADDREHYRRKSMSARVVGPLAKTRAVRSMLPTLTKLPNLSQPLREMFSREDNEPIPDISLLPPELIEFTSPPGTYFDAFPIHILTSASLNAMRGFNADALWDSRRFRPNFLIETIPEIKGLVEAGWSGRILRIGTAEIKCEIAAARCGMTTHAQQDLPKDPSVLRSIVKDANQNLGSYATVVAEGNANVGDMVELI